MDTFIKAIPSDLWSQAFTFQPWSELEGATIIVPRFKVLINLMDFPIHLWRETVVSKIVSQFGIYLGPVPQELKIDLSAWRVAIATDDMPRVPKAITITTGGLKRKVTVRPVTWQTGPVYGPSDFSAIPVRYTCPPP